MDQAYVFVLHICCALLAMAVAVLTVKLKRATDENKEIVSQNEYRDLSDDERAVLCDIEQGLDNEEFKMHLQFIVDNKTKCIVSAEALSRWERPNGETLFPAKYIGVMEKCGYITRLDYCMFEKACAKLEKWSNTLLGGLTLCCNFTRITISEKDFVSKIKEIADRYTFDRRKLLIEITEDSIEKNHSIALENILKVKEIGFRIALDDIGSGYTSLMNLCEYPIDVAKIDRDVLLMTGGERGEKLFLGIISLAHYLNLKVVCEGVETDEQNDLVTASDCDYVQGWYYSRSHSEENAEAFAEEYMSRLEQSNGI